MDPQAAFNVASLLYLILPKDPNRSKKVRKGRGLRSTSLTLYETQLRGRGVETREEKKVHPKGDGTGEEGTCNQEGKRTESSEES